MGKLPVLLLTGFLVFGLQVVSAQDETDIRTLVREGDRKKLEKADQYKANADKQIEESNRLNMEVFTVQADPALSEKSKAKKISQLEEQAILRQIEASGLYEKSNEIKFSVYKLYIDEFWKTHENQESSFLNAKLLEEQASDNYFQAVSYRMDARKMDGYAKVEKLNESEALENQAIQKQLTALGQYHGISGAILQENIVANDIMVSEPTVANDPEPAMDADDEADQYIQDSFIQEKPENTDLPDTTVYVTTASGVTVNQSMIDSYNRYIATGKFTDSTLSTGAIAGVTSFDSDRLLQLWYEYMYGRGSIVSEPDADLQADIVTEAGVDDPRITVVEPGTNTGKMEIGIVTDENVGTLIPADEEVIYRVQIAANRSELSQRALSKMYYGNKNVEMIVENDWYKYSVGDFGTYKEASDFREASGISNAYVVAYRKGTKFIGGQSAVGKQQQPVYMPSGENRLPSGLIFRIQVAAGRMNLTTGQLKRIYPGNYPVEIIPEEAWNKYQLLGVRLYSDANAILKNVTTQGAFISAYEDGQKINLADAIEKSRELEQQVKISGRKGTIQEIEFHVQLAASRIALPLSEVSALYSGSEPVSVMIEDGWYKYHLKAGNSPEVAEQMKNSCNVPGAFLVAYKRAAKVNAYQAIQEIK